MEQIGNYWYICIPCVCVILIHADSGSFYRENYAHAWVKSFSVDVFMAWTIHTCLDSVSHRNAKICWWYWPCTKALSGIVAHCKWWKLESHNVLINILQTFEYWCLHSNNAVAAVQTSCEFPKHSLLAVIIWQHGELSYVQYLVHL